METELLIKSVKAACEAGKILKRFYGSSYRVERKDGSFREIITEVDRLVEKCIIEILVSSLPKSTIWTEENGFIANNESHLLWIVDPIDGTVNYINGIPFCAVSIACIKDKTLHIGVIYNPFTNEYFYAQRNLGAWLNETPIKVSKATNLSESLLACAFSSKATPARQKEFSVFGSLNDLSRGCLRTGSAAINLAYVACGRLSGTWGHQLKVWDVMAGLLIVQEAGGEVNVDKIPWDQRNEVISCFATNGKIHEELSQKLSTILGQKYNEKI